MDESPDNKSVKDKTGKTAAVQKKKEKTAQNLWRSEYIFFALVIIVLVVTSIYFYREINNSQVTAAQTQQKIEVLQADLSRQISLLDKNLSKLASEQNALKHSLSELYQQQPADNEDWALSEIEYLLIIASHRLLLERDVNTALSAMEAASLRLQALSNPDLIPVRQQLTADINRLRGVNQVDTTGLALYLADLVERAESLPIKKPDIDTAENTADVKQDSMKEEFSFRNALSVIWRELKSLVVIRKSGEIRQALLMPDEEYFLTQNLRLELENARLAVLRHDTGNLQASITLLLDWLNRYYDTSDAAVSNIMDTLTGMATLELQPDLPDINSSLETLRAYMRQE